MTSLSLSSDSWTLVSAGRDKVVQTWDVRKHLKLTTVPVYEAVEGVSACLLLSSVLLYSAEYIQEVLLMQLSADTYKLHTEAPGCPALQHVSNPYVIWLQGWWRCLPPPDFQAWPLHRAAALAASPPSLPPVGRRASSKSGRLTAVSCSCVSWLSTCSFHLVVNQASRHAQAEIQLGPDGATCATHCC